MASSAQKAAGRAEKKISHSKAARAAETKQPDKKVPVPITSSSSAVGKDDNIFASLTTARPKRGAAPQRQAPVASAASPAASSSAAAKAPALGKKTAAAAASSAGAGQVATIGDGEQSEYTSYTYTDAEESEEEPEVPERIELASEEISD